MKNLTVHKKSYDKALHKRAAQENDASILVDESTIIRDPEGNILCVYIVEPTGWLEKTRSAIMEIDFDFSERASGLLTTSVIFGFRPASTMRSTTQATCSKTRFANRQAELNKILIRSGLYLDEIYRQYIPHIYTQHKEATDKILSNWKLHESVFTSGIVNKNNALPYHFDSGNFENVYSNMIAFKKGVQGGRLVIPEYDIKLEIQDCSVSMFDGQKLLHGVTPIIKTNASAYRFTAVYYSLKSMWKCLTPDEELKRGQKLRELVQENKYKFLKNKK